MRSPTAPWPVPPLSSEVPAAVDAYRAGVAALVAGGSSAEPLLRRCTGLDPGFFLGQLALAVCLACAGAPFACPPPTAPPSRPERQHAEIVRAAFGGQPAHALDLRREHLLEFPGDLLVVWLPLARPHEWCGGAVGIIRPPATRGGLRWDDSTARWPS